MCFLYALIGYGYGDMPEEICLKRYARRVEIKQKKPGLSRGYYLLYQRNAMINPIIAWNSIKANARIIGIKTLSDDVGFLAMPSKAEPAALP